MPTPVPVGLRLGAVEPRAAIAEFDQRNLLLPSFRWSDVWQQEHARGMAVAGVLRRDVLQLFVDELGQSLQQGRRMNETVDAIRGKLVAKGFWGEMEVTDPATGEVRMTRFNDARLRLIYDVNLGQAYEAGQWQRAQATKERFPYLQYVTMGDEAVRPLHAAWNGTVLPVDHPWWDTHHPKNGWRCRCRTVQLSQRQVDRLQGAGVEIKTEAPPVQYVDWEDRNGRRERVPVGIDPGFGYNPGKRPLRGAVPAPLLADPFDRTPSLAPSPALPFPRRMDAAQVLLPAATPAAQAQGRFLAAFGAQPGRPVEFLDAVGETLVIDAEMLVGSQVQPELWPAIAETIRMPDEIWSGTPMRINDQAQRLRRRYISRYVLDDGQRLAVVFEEGADGWMVKAARSEAEEQALLQAMRSGVRVHVRSDSQVQP
ncbi:phage minor head protein [Aquincola tertiaricarbonis]|uniref:Phage minor head protein n=1 Tax=Aquincola tertiaricarbonis TaxID=391953 RepID=A0ABY4S5P6_AQUTE|nr:phage minor head protein [Aquincola tertiaricarbonis]URI06635.1 phage minor head protein [Aquincola tertiaricarbonis]